MDGQISVHTVDPDRGIERLFARNGFAQAHVFFLAIFRSGDVNYLLAEQGRQAWKSVSKLEGSPDKGFELVAVRADRVRVFADGLRSTMAYGAEQGAFARFRDQETIEFIPE